MTTPDNNMQKIDMTKSVEKLMRQAMTLARRAARKGEVPVGALVVEGALNVSKPKILARAHNLTESRNDPAGHAEMIAIRRAAAKKKSWRLTDCTLIVTLEPCAMCAGVSVWGRVNKIIYGAEDPKAGACGSVLQVACHPGLNHRIELQGGVLSEECGQLLKDFFRAHRKRQKEAKQENRRTV